MKAPPAGRPIILLADGHPDMLRYLTRLLSEQYEIDAAADASAALTMARHRAPQLVVADISMRKAPDFDLAREFGRDVWGRVPIILYSAASEEGSCVDAVDPGDNNCLVAPFSEQQLLALVRAQLEVVRLRGEAIRARRLSEERFRTLKTMMTSGVWTSTARGEIVEELAWWWERMTGQTPEQYRGFGYLDVVHPNDRQHVIETRRRSLENTTAYQEEFRIRTRDGSYRYVRNQGAPVRDADGNVREWVGTITDIDDQKRTAEALRLSEESYRILATKTSSGVWRANPNGDIVGDCRGWEEITGQSNQQGIGWGWTDVLHPDDKQPVVDHWKHCVQQVIPYEASYRNRRSDGSYAFIRAQAAPVLNDDGSVREWIGTIVDIDDQKQAEEALRETEEEFRKAFEVIGVGRVQTDPKTGRFMRVNSAFCNMVGYSVDELLTMTYLDLMHPEDRPTEVSALGRFLRDETDHDTFEFRYMCKDGSIRWCRRIATLIRDSHHHPSRTNTIVEDVTERRQYEALSQCQKQALELVAQGASLAEVLDFVILAVEREALVPVRGSILLPDEDGHHLRLCAAPSLPESYCQAVAGRPTPDAFNRVAIVSNLEDSPEWADIASVLVPVGIRSMWARPILSSAQKILGSFCLFSSRSLSMGVARRNMIDEVVGTIALAIERKEVEAERERRLAAEQAANRMKDEFLAVVSHELRTPLSAINGWAHLLQSNTLDETARDRALQSILRQVSSQSQLIEDLLDVARITAGKIRLELSDIEPSKVVAAAIDVVRPAALSKQIELVTNLDATAVAVSADPERLQQVIWNLLTNAIKFTPERGRVEIRLRYVDSNMEITVSDTGQGIREDFLPYVFDRFRQADVSETRTHGGVGLGLSIVRHLVDLHHGTVSVKSDGEGKGATFTLLLPVRHAEENRSAANHPQHEMEAQ